MPANNFSWKEEDVVGRMMTDMLVLQSVEELDSGKKMPFVEV